MPAQGQNDAIDVEGSAMRDGATEKKIRLGEVASALNVAPKLIRNWTAKEEFDLLGDPDRQANKWRQYSYVDVAHLAIAAQAIRYGFSIEEAHDYAGAALARILEPVARNGTRLANAPGGAVEAICQGKNLYLFKLSDGESVMILTPLDDLPAYHGAVHIDLAMCVGMAFSGLAEIGHDAFSDSRPKEYSAAEVEELDRSVAKLAIRHPVLATKVEETAE